MNPYEPREDHTLLTAIAALRGEYNEQPPEHIEAALRTRFQQRRRRKRAPLWSVCGTAAAAAAILFAWISTPHRRPPQAIAIAAHSSPPHEAARLPDEQIQRAQARLVRRLRKSRKTPVPNAPVAGPREFVAIPYAEPLSPSEQVDVYRVELPRVTLAQYGIPIRAGALDSSITADLVVGSDGVARAIRFVQ